MVVNISQVLSGDWNAVKEDIRAVVDVAHAAGQKVKVIFENCYLKDEHKIRLCEICNEVNADWVKTSTGYGTGGATHEDLALMRKHAPPHVQVKAAGGVRASQKSVQETCKSGSNQQGCLGGCEVTCRVASSFLK